MKRLHSLFALLLTLSMLLAACGGGSKKPEAPAAAGHGSAAPTATGGTQEAAAAPKELTPVKMAVSGKGSIIYLPPALAEYKGFFKEEGIDPQVQDVKGGSQTIEMLVAGEVDFGSAALEHVVKYQAKGVDLVMLALYTRYPGITLVVDSKLKDQVKTPADLKGMKIGITSTGSGTHKATISILAKHGIKPTEVEFIGVGTSGAPEALESGKVAAFMGLDPWVTDVVSQGKAFILWDLRTRKDTVELYGDDFPFVGLVTRREVVQKNPEMVQRVVNAVVKANKFITTHDPAEVASVMPAELKGVPDTLYIASLKAGLEAFSPDGIVTAKGAQVVVEALKADKAIPADMDVPVTKIFEGSFAQHS